MVSRTVCSWLAVVPWLAMCFAALAYAPQSEAKSNRSQSVDAAAGEPLEPRTRPAQELITSLEPAELREIASEVLSRSPEIARARRLATAAALRAPQVRALPDPVAALNIFLLPAETRAGPQQLSASIQQRLPWLGKLALREKAALLAAAAAESEVEAMRLDLITEARRLLHELGFLEAHEGVIEVERSALVRYEKAAQARYASGTGLQQEIVRIQAQITRADTLLLEISERRTALLTTLNRLRDRPASTPIGPAPMPRLQPPLLDPTDLRHRAQGLRPELAAAEARIAAAEAAVELAEKGYRPDLTVGLSYTAVGRRNDAAGRLAPPEDNGDDILALSGSLNLPVRRRKLEAAIEEARATKWAAEEDRRRVLAEIEASIGDLTARLPLLFRHQQLLEGVLLKQAREALRSAETAYSTGKLNAVDLLDAEVVLFEVQIAAARTRADLGVAWAQLERAAASPLYQPAGESTP